MKEKEFTQGKLCMFNVYIGPSGYKLRSLLCFEV